MFNQSTTTVLTTLITVLGTLGGVLLGVILTNRYTWKQEKAKRNIPIIEEAYTLINQLNDIIDEYLQENSLLINGMKEKTDRLRTVVNLYLRSVKGKYSEYSKAHWQLMTMLRDNEGHYHQDDKNTFEVEETKTYWEYRGRLATFMTSLEKLVD